MLKISHFGTEYGYFHPRKYLVDVNQVRALFDPDSIDVEENKIEMIKTHLLAQGFTYLIHAGGDEMMKATLLSKDNKCIITLGATTISMIADYTAEDRVKTYEYLLTHKLVYSSGRKISRICKSGGELRLVSKTLKSESPIPMDNYSFTYPYDSLMEKLRQPGPGIMLFEGPPGTGKSYFIRHLVREVKQHFVYIPVDTAGVLADPAFMSFAIDSLENAILVIEDAETVLVDRQKAHNSAASTLLNVSDGILGEILGAKIIATVNVKENIDSALLRKGRLMAQVNFDKLPVDQANRVLERLKIESKVDTPTSLGDLYNLQENTGHVIQSRQIGFRPPQEQFYDVGAPSFDTVQKMAQAGIEYGY